MRHVLVLVMVALVFASGDAGAIVELKGSQAFKNEFWLSVATLMTCTECKGETGKLQHVVKDVLTNPDYLVIVKDNSGNGVSRVGPLGGNKFELLWEAELVQTMGEPGCNFEDQTSGLAHELAHAFL